MDVKQGPFGPYEDVIKSEPDVSSQIEGNYCTYTNQQMFNNDHDSCLFDDKDDIFCEHQTTEQSPTRNSLNVGEIKQEIIECEESKIEYRPCDLPTKVEHDSVCEKEQLVSTTVKKELNIHDVVDVSEVIAKQEVTENIQAKTESELLTSYCDLPTLKCESAEYSDNLVQPCSSKHAERTLKTLKTKANVSKKKRRRYPCAVCQKDFQDASICPPTDKPSEIEPIPSIQIDTAIQLEDEELLLSELKSFSSGDAGSEYVPSDESRSSSTVPDTECESLPVDDFETFSSMETDKVFTGETNTKELVEINCAKKTSAGKRIRNKDHSCYFCHKLLRNLARHFEGAHSNETEVDRILRMPKNSKRRREAFNALTRNGDFYHNCDVLLLQKGELILTRRPTERESKFLKYSDYGPCPECLGFMIKRHLWHHLKYACICMRDKHILSSEKSSRLPAAESTSLLNGIYGHNLTEDFRSNILNKLRSDEISQICSKDDLILRFGAFLHEKYNNTQAELIRQSMRQLGRLTIELVKQNTDVHKLIDALTPEKFDAVVLAAKSLCVTSNEIALKIGYSLRKCIGIERGLCLRKGDLKRNEILLGFLSILDLEWSNRISSNTSQFSKLNSIDLLPITSDLIKLNKFLELMIQETTNYMKNEKSFQNWSKLASLTLSRIIIFNKKRSREIAKMKIEHYTSQSQSKSEIKESLTEFETNLANFLPVVEIIGKRKRKVPVLLTKEMKESIDFLLATRAAVRVPRRNPFVFARLGALKSHMDGHDCIKKWCSEAKLELLETVTTTKLGKYVTTVCQVLNLKENEYDWLKRHLGHDIKVHRQFYRLHENPLELTKVSRLLLAVDQGKAHTFAGKSLDDIEVKDLPPIEEDSSDQNDEEASDGEDEEIPRNSAEISGRSTLNEEEELGSEPFIEKKKQQSKNNKSKRTKSEAALARVPWNDSEKEVLLKKCKVEIKNEILPGKDKCTKIKEEHIDVLSRRSWTDIKFFVKNVITRNKRKKK